jgi:hypothetical protein
MVIKNHKRMYIMLTVLLCATVSAVAQISTAKVAGGDRKLGAYTNSDPLRAGDGSDRFSWLYFSRLFHCVAGRL